MSTKSVVKILIHSLLILSVLVIAFPVIYALITSTQGFKEVFSYPPKIMPGSSFIANYFETWHRINMERLLFNTTLISVVVAVVKIILSIMAAFAFTYFGKFKGWEVFFIANLITQMLPLPIRIIPTFEMMKSFNWVNTYYALSVPFFASTTGMLLFRQFFLTVPSELSDAARVDGAGPIRFLTQILVPLSRTNIAALFGIEFVFMWSQYLWPLVITNTREMRVIQIGLKMLLASEQRAPEWNIIMAGAIIAMLPPLTILLILRKSFVKGIAVQTEK